MANSSLLHELYFTSLGGDGRTVPEANRTGHHPEVDQDKPDLDAFAERLGVRADESDEAGRS